MILYMREVPLSGDLSHTNVSIEFELPILILNLVFGMLKLCSDYSLESISSEIESPRLVDRLTLLPLLLFLQ